MNKQELIKRINEMKVANEKGTPNQNIRLGYRIAMNDILELIQDLTNKGEK